MLLETSPNLHPEYDGIGFLLDETSVTILQCSHVKYMLNADQDLSTILQPLCTHLYPKNIVIAIHVQYPLPPASVNY